MHTIEQRVFLVRFYRLTGLFSVKRLSERFPYCSTINEPYSDDGPTTGEGTLMLGAEEVDLQ
jgi:hypothetical protein